MIEAVDREPLVGPIRLERLDELPVEAGIEIFHLDVYPQIAEHRERFLERGDRLTVPEPRRSERLEWQCSDRAVAGHHGVVMHDELAVGGRVNVELDPV